MTLEERLAELQLDMIGVPGGPLTFELLDRAMRQAAEIGAELERKECVRIADDIGRNSMSGVAAQISNTIRARGRR